MYTMIETTVLKEELTLEDVEMLVALLTELRDRLSILMAMLPLRGDAKATKGAEIDVELAREMLQQGASDAADVGRRAALVESVHAKLRLLCAPVQDEDVDALQAAALGEPTPARALATLLVRADAVISYTEFLKRGQAGPVS